MEIGYLSLVGTVQQNVQVSIGDGMLQVVDQEGEVTTFRYWLRNNFLIGVEAGDEVVIQYFNDQTTGISGQEMAVWKRTEAGDRLVFLGHTTEENPWGGGTLHVEVVPRSPVSVQILLGLRRQAVAPSGVQLW